MFPIRVSHTPLVLMLLLSPPSLRTAEACFCGAIQPCEAVGSADAVFVGTVMERARESAGGNLQWTVHRFAVSEVLLGKVEPTVTLVPLGRPSAEELALSVSEARGWNALNSCDYGFEVGRQYLVYATRAADGRLTTGACAGTKPIALAAADLEYIASLREVETAAVRISIQRIQRDAQVRSRTNGVPAAGIPVSISGRPTNITLRTDAEGKLDARLPAGDYTILPMTPDSVHVPGGSRRISVPAQGCAPLVFHLVSNGRIEGRVVREDGSAVRRISVGVIPADVPDFAIVNGYLSGWIGPQTMTDDGGRFTLEAVLPGSYLLAVNPRLRYAWPSLYATTYFPGVSERHDARLIEIRDGERKTGVTIRVTSMPEATISGRVVFADGHPVAAADLTVVVADNPGHVIASGTTNRQGAFRLRVLRGATYIVRARTGTGEGTETRIYVNQPADDVLLSISR